MKHRKNMNEKTLHVYTYGNESIFESTYTTVRNTFLQNTYTNYTYISTHIALDFDAFYRPCIG